MNARQEKLPADRLVFATVMLGAASGSVLASAPIIGRPAGGSAEGAPLGTTQQGAAPAGAQPAPAPGGGMQLFFIMFGVLALMIFMQMSAGRKEKKRRAAMMASLGRHDRVQMMGGIIGTIMEVHDDEVVVKVDEATNTRIRFARTAVQTILKKASDGRQDVTAPETVGAAS